METGGGGHNRRFVKPALVVGDDVAPGLVALAHDPQTSGGLLAAVRADQAEAIQAVLETSGVGCWQVGRVEASTAPGVTLLA